MMARYRGAALHSNARNDHPIREERIILVSALSGASPVTDSSTALPMPNERISPASEVLSKISLRIAQQVSVLLAEAALWVVVL
jgi:hypothetical protein